ncbi:hypothetical protein COLO4_28894 [Corchorus olitorius]|uniref:Uncharacterized protein n=1 Tax=Corchorus olitorius TaxID=93759 RepID=A0A1R3HHS5_9ROSI|nr:hypothetical protein COLO4_28894 [Corchorus olitorius]
MKTGRKANYQKEMKTSTTQDSKETPKAFTLHSWPLELECVKDHRNSMRFAVSAYVLMLSWLNAIFLGSYTISSRVK